jgi:hypothetical protein
LPGRLLNPVENNKIAEDILAFASFIEYPKEPHHFLKISYDETRHSSIDSISRKFSSIVIALPANSDCLLGNRVSLPQICPPPEK